MCADLSTEVKKMIVHFSTARLEENLGMSGNFCLVSFCTVCQALFMLITAFTLQKKPYLMWWFQLQPLTVEKPNLNIHYFTDDLKRTADLDHQKSAIQINRPDIHTKPTKTNLNILIKLRLIKRFFFLTLTDHILRQCAEIHLLQILVRALQVPDLCLGLRTKQSPSFPRELQLFVLKVLYLVAFTEGKQLDLITHISLIS